MAVKNWNNRRCKIGYDCYFGLIKLIVYLQDVNKLDQNGLKTHSFDNNIWKKLEFFSRVSLYSRCISKRLRDHNGRNKNTHILKHQMKKIPLPTVWEVVWVWDQYENY